MDNKFEYVYWDDVRRDMKYPESDNNQGFTYGVNLLDENYEIIDVQWFKSEEDRDSFISAEDLKEAEYPDEFEAGGKVNRDKKIVKYKDGRNRKLSTWNEGAGYTKDRESFNKSEDWEIPMNERANAKRSKSSGTTKSTNSRGYEYIPNRMLREAEIENKGKTTYIDAANILDGIYVKKGTKYEEGGDMMEKGGKVKNYKYIPNHMIQAMEVERKGKTTEIDGANILDGIYVKGKTKFEEGGSPDIYDFDNKMALINISQISEYAIKLDNIVQEDSNLEEWVKMKLTRVEQNVADVKKSLNGWNKFEDFEDGGRIFKKQLLHIAKYADELMEMIKSGSKLMSELEYEAGGGVGKYLVWYDIYDEQTGKTLDIQAYSLEEAEQIASTIEFENFRDGEEIPYGEFESGGGVDYDYDSDNRSNQIVKVDFKTKQKNLKKRNQIFLNYSQDDYLYRNKFFDDVLKVDYHNIDTFYTVGYSLPSRGKSYDLQDAFKIKRKVEEYFDNKGQNILVFVMESPIPNANIYTIDEWMDSSQSYAVMVNEILSEEEYNEIGINKFFEEGGNISGGVGMEISKEQLESMVGRKLNGWNDDKVMFNGTMYQKCFLRPFYKKC